MSDWELLQEYVQTGSESAFAELVRRHLDWVYSAAVRQVHDRHLAEDVAQAVFIALMQRAGRLPRSTVLVAWLFQVTRCASINALRAQRRRRHHEQEAAMAKQTTSTTESAQWEQLAPVLDEGVTRLRERDRVAVLLRFYQGKSFAEIGAALGISEEAARKRTERAVGKLRGSLRARGALVPATALAALLQEQTTQASPTSLFSATVCSVLERQESTAATGIAKGALKTMAIGKIKVAAAILAGTLLCMGGTGAVVHALAGAHEPAAMPATRPSSALAALREAIRLLNAGDVDGFRRYVQTSSALETSTLQGALHYALARRHYQEAVRERFGEASAAALTGIEMGGQVPADAQETIQGDRATITVPGETRGIEMVRVGNVWKLPYTRAIGGMQFNAPPSQKLAAKLEEMARAVEAQARELRSGQYGTAAEALEAMAALAGQSGDTSWQRDLEKLVDQGLPATQPHRTGAQ